MSTQRNKLNIGSTLIFRRNLGSLETTNSDPSPTLTGADLRAAFNTTLGSGKLNTFKQ